MFSLPQFGSVAETVRLCRTAIGGREASWEQSENASLPTKQRIGQNKRTTIKEKRNEKKREAERSLLGADETRRSFFTPSPLFFRLAELVRLRPANFAQIGAIPHNRSSISAITRAASLALAVLRKLERQRGSFKLRGERRRSGKEPRGEGGGRRRGMGQAE